MNYFHNERGYTLFLTVLILLLFSILSVSLLTFTISGAKKSKIREDVTQAEELSEKGIKHITQQVNKDAKNSLDQDGLPRSEFATNLTIILNEYLCMGGSKFITKDTDSGGNYKVCIIDFKNTTDENNNENELRKLVEFKSTGEVNGHTKEVTSKVEIGSSSIPEVLKYTLGTNIESDYPKNGEGNLILHGSADIRGDIKVDGHLITYEKGVAGYEWIPSLLPRVLSITGSTSPKLVLGKNMYQIKSDPYNTSPFWNNGESLHRQYLNKDNFDNASYSKKDNPKDLFQSGYVPQIIKRNPVANKINIIEQRDSFYFDQNTPGVKKYSLGSSAQFKDFSNTSHDIIPTVKRCNYCSEDVNKPFNLIRKNKFKKLASGNNVKILEGDHFFDEGFYVGGNLTIGNGLQTDNTSSRDNIELEGPIYVDGDVQIQGANLKSHAMMYVNGDVTIRFSSINGKELSNGGLGSLIVFTTGDVFLANNSVNKSTPSTIKGYFYSEKDFEMYGVGSNIRVEGGISARRIVLNAIRGKSSNNWFPGSFLSSGSHYEGVSNQKYKDSRLQVEYDTELIENFLKLNPPEPVIYNVDPPKLIDRK